MKINISYGNSVFSLPRAVIDYIDKADNLKLRLMLLLAGNDALCGDFDIDGMAKCFAVNKKEIEAALEFWSNAGIIEYTQEQTLTQSKSSVSVTKHVSENGSEVTLVQDGKTPHYTGAEIEAIMSSNSQINSLINECQQIAGKMFGVLEMNKLLGLADYLRLEHEYIVLLFSYCKSIGKPSVHYVEKTAFGLCNDGIDNFVALEQYIAQAQRKGTLEKYVRELFGTGSRALSAKEKNFVSEWADREYSQELIRMAYEVTVDKTGEASFPYANKVLSNWRESGYTTQEQVNAALDEYKQKKELKNGNSSFDIDEFFEAALKKSYANIKK